MATYSKVALSQATTGVPIAVGATGGVGTNGTTIHATGTSGIDEIWLYATNTDSTARTLTIQFGGNALISQVQQSIPANSGLTLIIPGLILAPSGSAITVYAYASITSVVNISGYVNRIA
jgi:hypothetical protein